MEGGPSGCITAAPVRPLPNPAYQLNLPGPAVGPSALSRRNPVSPPTLRKPGNCQFTKACAWLANALIRRHAMLSTTANPTDGLQFDGDAMASPQVLLIP